MNDTREATIGNLNYVKGMLSAMAKLNQEELLVRSQIKPMQSTKVNYVQKSNQKWQIIVLLIVACVVLTLISALSATPKAMEDSKTAYETAVVDDEFNWAMSRDERENPEAPYPGYQGPVQEPLSFKAACIKNLLIFGAIYLILVVLTGVIIFAWQRTHHKAVDQENKKRGEQQQMLLSQNNQNAAYNQGLIAKIEELRRRKILISQEFITNICSWFPREYAYAEAINYFIHELQFQTAKTFPEAIMNYRQFLFRNKVTSKLDEISENQRIMIHNQEIIIAKQDEMIRQQMMGNFLACATWLETKNIAKSVNSIDKKTFESTNYYREGYTVYRR